MGFNAPTMHGDMAPGVLDRRQAAVSASNPALADITKKVQQLQSYPAFIQAISTKGGPEREKQAWDNLLAEAKQKGINIPDDSILDAGSGIVRGQTWAERHPVLQAVLITAGFAGGGAALGAGLGAAGAGSAGAALGPTTTASMAGTEAALAGSTVPAALAPTVAGGTTAAAGGSAATKFLTSPAGASLVSGGLQTGQNILNNKANAAEGAAARQQQKDILLSQISGDQQSDNLSRDTSYLNSTQMNPVKQQQDIFRAGILRAMGQQGAPQIQRGAGVVNKFDAAPTANQYLNDDALANSAARFYGAAGSVSNTAPPADLSKMGFNTNTEKLQSQLDTEISGARTGRQDLAQRRRDELMGRITPPPAPTPTATDYFNRRK